MTSSVLILDRRERITWVNAAFEALTGASLSEVAGELADGFNPDVTPPEVVEEMRRTLRSGQTWIGERSIHDADGSRTAVLETIEPVCDGSGGVTRYLVIQHRTETVNGTSRRDDRLVRLDPLTNLPNRGTLEEQLGLLGDLSGQEVGGALLLLDLDHFNIVNDSLGHAIGDRVLVAVAEILAGALGEGDMLARWGGDEFAVLMTQATGEEALAVARDLQARIAGYRIHLGSRTVTLNCAIGIALIDGSLDPSRTLSLVDSALYEARDKGAGQVVLLSSHESERRSRLLEESQWVTRIRDALGADRLTLRFQPVVRLEGGSIEHHEVLVRMLDDDGGLIHPSAFIPIAERFGLIDDLDLWVLHRVVDLLSSDRDMKLFVNVSGRAYENHAFTDEVAQAHRLGEIQPGQLVLEVTETAAVRDFERARDWIARLTDVGCAFALDDFGTGYCTFSYLRSLPVEYVKIDRSLVRHVGFEAGCGAIVEAIVAVADSLGKKVIAEGVESRRTMQRLREMGIEYGQGFYWGRPDVMAAVPSRLEA